MHDYANYRVHLCAVAAVFVFSVGLFVAHARWRFRLFPVDGEPTRKLPNLKPICSFGVFRNIAGSRADGFVSGNGTWNRNTKGVPEYFQPEICRLRHNLHIPRQELLQCIRRQRLRYVVFAGDSNSLRYFAAFQALLTNVGAHCSSIQVCFLNRKYHC